ncbi:hypothetical protein C7974DRAFT_452483 [Boeremia exigua]|uniref:uncharacterized protein n=1 Tax=Boeremia exigua TaxID=749465 RepID=UPI001E8E724C|nr:uncharacterized protein C7974DRAFT_452483 [Boeremia exigua]KAH6633261.1 hypothetical protein C7974DRAFT_452483 [Boeremia exigua]
MFPNYQHSVAEVYTIAAKHVLEQSESMLFFTCVEGEDFQTRNYGLPSWVPDWSIAKFTGLRVTGYRHFNAAEQRLPTYSISHDMRMLSIEAVKVDDIVEICEEKNMLRANLQSSTMWKLLSMLDSTYSTGHGTQTREELGTLAVCSGNWSTDSLPSAFCHRQYTTQDELEKARLRAKSDPAYLANLAHKASLYDLHFSHAMLPRPFRTRRGYFGIGTQCLRKGDCVWIVSGCRVPIILRRIDGSKRFRLVGGSYTHGLMDGEGLNQPGAEFEMVSLE